LVRGTGYYCDRIKQMGEMRYASRVGTEKVYSEDLKGTDQFGKLMLD